MSGNLFFDTNVAIYAYDDSDPAKQSEARSRLIEADASTQS